MLNARFMAKMVNNIIIIIILFQFIGHFTGN